MQSARIALRHLAKAVDMGAINHAYGHHKLLSVTLSSSVLGVADGVRSRNKMSRVVELILSKVFASSIFLA